MRKTHRQEVPNEDITIAEVWESAKKIAPRIDKSASYVYKLVRESKELQAKGKNGGIPFAEPSKGTILFSWTSVNAWLHELENKKQEKHRGLI